MGAPAATSSGPRAPPVAPSGIQLAIPLATARMSGTTPKCSAAHILPVRPIPTAPRRKSEEYHFVGPRASVRRKTSGRNHLPALALHRLEHDGGGFLRRRDGFLRACLRCASRTSRRRSPVPGRTGTGSSRVGRWTTPGSAGRNGGAARPCWREREGAHGAPVKTAEEGDDLVAPVA